MNIQEIVRLSDTVKKSYEDLPHKSRWKSSPFLWLYNLKIGEAGSATEELVKTWLKDKGRNPTPRTHKHHDFMMDGMRYEVKLGMLGKDNDYTFNAFYENKFDCAYLVSIDPPNRIRIWLVPSRDVIFYGKSQHGKNNNYMIQFKRKQIPDWIREHLVCDTLKNKWEI